MNKNYDELLSADKYRNFQKVIKNSARCKKCNDVIVSEYGHDFKNCKCGEIFIDGGKSLHCRRGAGNFDNFENLSIIEPFDMADINQFIDITEKKISSAYYMSDDYYIKELKNAIEYRSLLESKLIDPGEKKSHRKKKTPKL